MQILVGMVWNQYFSALGCEFFIYGLFFYVALKDVILIVDNEYITRLKH